MWQKRLQKARSRIGQRHSNKTPIVFRVNHEWLVQSTKPLQALRMQNLYRFSRFRAGPSKALKKNRLFHPPARPKATTRSQTDQSCPFGYRLGIVLGIVLDRHPKWKTFGRSPPQAHGPLKHLLLSRPCVVEAASLSAALQQRLEHLLRQEGFINDGPFATQPV